MAQSKDDILYGTAQAKVSEDDALRVRYKSGTPLEGGKIADSEPVDLLVNARNIQKAAQEQQQQESVASGNSGADQKNQQQPRGSSS